LWVSCEPVPVCGLLCNILTAIQSTSKSARLPGPLPQQSSYQLLGPEWQSMGDFALGHYPTHGLVGLFTCEYWQEPWDIHRWMTALLRSGRKGYSGRKVANRLTPVIHHYRILCPAMIVLWQWNVLLITPSCLCPALKFLLFDIYLYLGSLQLLLSENDDFTRSSPHILFPARFGFFLKRSFRS
jgi:hypothetical protein